MPRLSSEFAGVLFGLLGHSRPSEALFSDLPRRLVGLSPRFRLSARFLLAGFGISPGSHHQIAVALSH